MPIRRKVTKKKATKKRAVRKVAKKRAVRKVAKKRAVRKVATMNDADEFARLIKRMSHGSTARTVQYDRTRNEGSGQISGLGEIFFWEGNDGINFQILGPIRIKAESNRHALRVLEQLQRVVFDS